MATLDALLQLQRLMALGRNPANPEMNDGGGQTVDPAVAAYIQMYGVRPGQALPMPSGLPAAVQRSIQNERSYGESDVIPRAPERTPLNYQNFAIEGQQYARERERLSRELDFLRGYNDLGNPLKEGRAPAAAPDPYSRPYNLGLGNLGALF